MAAHDSDANREDSAPFASAADLILAPQFAGTTDEANQRIGAATVAHVRALLEGRS